MTVRTINLLTGEETQRDYTQEELDAIANTPAPVIVPQDGARHRIERLLKAATRKGDQAEISRLTAKLLTF